MIALEATNREPVNDVEVEMAGERTDSLNQMDHRRCLALR